MTRQDYEVELRRRGFEYEFSEQSPDFRASEHAHEFDACALILSGQVGITINGKERIYSAGESFDVPAGRLHSERVVGPEPLCLVFGHALAARPNCS
jgi:quercetin dioxygenase-like cupin family protein